MIAARGGRVLLAALVVLGATAAGVLERDELISIDRPVTSFVFAHREPWLTSTPHAEALVDALGRRVGAEGRARR